MKLRRANRRSRHREPDAAPPSDVIIYVEDEDANWATANARLSERYRLLRARDDREACELLSSRGREAVAVLMDIELKGSVLSGVDLTRALRGKAKREDLPPYAHNLPVLDTVPILFVTAYAARYDEKELLEAGGSRMITKPVDFVSLLLTLAELCFQKVRDMAAARDDEPSST